MNNQIFISLGSNLGNKKAKLLSAFDEIELLIGTIVSKSSFYESEPWGYSSNEFFVNCVIEIASELDAFQTLNELHRIETKLGRLRKDTLEYIDRTIDLDLLYFGNQIIENQIIVPHPRLYLRKFVLVPLNEIAKDFVDPLKNKTIHQLLNECEDKSLLIKA